MSNPENEYPQFTNDMLADVTQHFFKNGIRSVDMEEIAKILGITKKYLYQLVSTKGELVAKCAKFVMIHFTENLNAAAKKAKDPVEEFILVNDFISTDYSSLNPKSFRELRNYYPTAYKIYSDFHFGFNETFIMRNLNEGVDQGLYRDDIHRALLTRIYLNTTINLLEDDSYPFDQFSYPATRIEFIIMFLRGILTDKNQQLLDKYLEEYKPRG